MSSRMAGRAAGEMTDGSARAGSVKSHRVRQPRQDRSRESLDRIIQATRTLLEGRDFETISVQEICSLAGVSLSSFYSRFETKEALLFQIHENHREHRVQVLRDYVGGIDWEGLPLVEVVRACLTLYVQDRRSYDPFLRAMMIAEMRFPTIAERRAEVDAMGVDLIGAQLLARIESPGPELPQQIEFGMRAVCAAAQVAIRPPNNFAARMQLSDEELVDNLTLLFCRYVGIA